MKKLFITLLALTLLFSVSCTKEVPEDIPENKEETVLTPIEQAREYINNEEFEKAYELLITLEGDEAEELLSHFSFKPAYYKNISHVGDVFEQEYEYDGHGNLVKQWDSEGNCSEYEYDEGDRRTKAVYKTNDKTQVLVWVWDENDNIIEHTLTKDGVLDSKSTFTYDEKGNCTSSHSESSNGYVSDWTAEYNENGDFIRYSSKTPQIEHTNTFEYDSENRLIKETISNSLGAVTVEEYEYNENGHVYTITSEGKVLQKTTYDKEGREIYSEYVPEFKTGLIRQEIEYAENGLMKRKTRVEVDENGIEHQSRENYTFDEQGRIVKKELSYPNGDVFLAVTTYHENGKPASHEERQNGERILLQLFNDDGLMIKYTMPSYDYTYEYDEHGNRLTQTDALSDYHEEYKGYKLYYHPTNFNNQEIY